MHTIESATAAGADIQLSLRPDVNGLVARLIADHRDPPAGVNPWHLYSRAKDQISHQCGWDACGGRYDQRQYDLAVRTYVDGVGL